MNKYKTKKVKKWKYSRENIAKQLTVLLRNIRKNNKNINIIQLETGIQTIRQNLLAKESQEDKYTKSCSLKQEETKDIEFEGIREYEWNPKQLNDYSKAMKIDSLISVMETVTINQNKLVRNQKKIIDYINSKEK